MLNHSLADSFHDHDLLLGTHDAVACGFRFAYQPIVRLDNIEVVGQEALVRGLGGESAVSVIDAIRPDNRYWFDQACRMRAIETAAAADLTHDLHLNGSQVTPANLAHTLQATRAAALDAGIDPRCIVLEFGNLELLGDPRSLDRVRLEAHSAGFRVLADNVGFSEVGLKRLAVFKPDFAKLDRSLIQGIDRSPRRQAIVLGIVALARALRIEIIAGGIETTAERDWLQSAGVELAQGYLFAEPCLGGLTETIEIAFDA